jgi:7-cyano-7-deazaguanine reductase
MSIIICCFVLILTYNALTMSNNILETFENPKIDREYTINFEIPEFTSLCPKTGQPDFANILIEYIPDKLCVELKSLKLYFVSFRDQPGFHEDLTNKILDDLVGLLDPKYMNINAEWNVRGGVYTSISATHEK